MRNYQKLVPGFLDEICLWMTQADASDEKITNVQIVLGEVMNNIIEHGFKNEGTGLIEIEIFITGDGITVRLCDDGVEFTPPEASQSPLQDKDNLDDLPEGGFGWFLIKEITSSIELKRRENKNHLTLNFI